MIAACPRCKTRYRIEREKLRPEGVRLRCTRCEALFRVRAPQEEAAAAAEAASAPSHAVGGAAGGTLGASSAESSPAASTTSPATEPGSGGDGARIGVAIPDEDVVKQTTQALRDAGYAPFGVHDGVEAMLEIQRQLPDVVVLSATLPKMYGFQICEIVKRNESLRHIQVVLVGAIHHKDRYRRPPDDLYGADAYVEEPDLPEGLLPILSRFGYGGGAAEPDPEPPTPLAPPMPEPPTPLAPPTSPTPLASPPEPSAETRVPRSPESPKADAPLARSPQPRESPDAEVPIDPGADDGLEPERDKAERLARIIVSDIVLYNEARFSEALRVGNVVEALSGEVNEGRALFAERVDERVRGERDHLVDELLRVARSRGMD